MKKSWLKEISRDLLALGSIPFYFLVVIRAIIGKDYTFAYQMLIAAILIFILNFIVKDSNLYLSRALVILVFTSLFYKEMIFTIFATSIWILGLLAAYYLRRKIRYILRAIIIGFVSSIAAYYLAPLL